MADLLTVRSLRHRFGTRNPTYAVDGVSFSLPQEPIIVSLVGESGSGKSTIARIVLGLLQPTEGEVLYNGRDIFSSDAAWQRKFRREVQAVFQNPYAVYNPAYKIERVFRKPIQKFGLALNRHEADDKIAASLRAVDLRPEEVLGKYPHQLSGGQRQRVMLARLHLIRPRLIIADEAVSMVDAAGRVNFLNILLDFRDRYGISTLYITHDLSTAEYLGGQIIVLYKGRIVERGDTATIMHAPLHPYARLLIDSVPVADPKKRWREALPQPNAATPKSSTRERCLFAARCPHVMDRCWLAQPELRRPAALPADSDQETACHLYEAAERSSVLDETESLFKG
ncbi:MAG: ABC transporter ATP-binding protein [Candidatus Roseilinea sp.]|nr:MAG: ABC transporter ATP-binding protein [Candidatus Roseilinea sp.]